MKIAVLGSLGNRRGVDKHEAAKIRKRSPEASIELTQALLFVFSASPKSRLPCAASSCFLG